MSRPAEIPVWMYPGTRVMNRATRHSWLIESIQFRGREGYHAFLKPEGQGISGWFPVENVVSSFYVVGSSPYPTLLAVELSDLVYRGLVNVGPVGTIRGARVWPSVPGGAEDDVMVYNITDEPVEASEVVLQPGVNLRVHCPGWEGTYMQLTENRQMMVAFDDHRPMPYFVREIQADAGVLMVLESSPFFEEVARQTQEDGRVDALIETNDPRIMERLLLDERVEVGTWEEVCDAVNAIRERSTRSGLTWEEVIQTLDRPTPEPEPPPPPTLPEPPSPPPAPIRRISVWERIAALRNENGPDAIPGGAGTGRRTHTTDTTDDEDGVH